MSDFSTCDSFFLPILISRSTPVKVSESFLILIHHDFFSLSTESEDHTNLWNTLREKISLVKYVKECPGQGTFGHITGGYDAGYYGHAYILFLSNLLLKNCALQLYLLTRLFG